MELKEWLNSIPVITRHWFVLSFIIPLLGRFGILSAQWMYLDSELVLYKFHFWRPLSSLIYYPVVPQTGFHWLMMLYFLYNYSKGLEEGVYSGRPADYFYMLLINWVSCVLIGMALSIPFLLEPMVLSVLYVWCRLNSETIVSFWFGMKFKALYLPFVLCAFNMVIRGGGINEGLGILIGHIYYFLEFQYPELNGTRLIQTPEFLYRFLPNQVGGVQGVAGRISGQARPQVRGHQWGQGAQLGGN